LQHISLLVGGSKQGEWSRRTLDRQREHHWKMQRLLVHPQGEAEVRAAPHMDHARVEGKAVEVAVAGARTLATVAPTAVPQEQQATQKGAQNLRAIQTTTARKGEVHQLQPRLAVRGITAWRMTMIPRNYNILLLNMSTLNVV